MYVYMYWIVLLINHFEIMVVNDAMLSLKRLESKSSSLALKGPDPFVLPPPVQPSHPGGCAHAADFAGEVWYCPCSTTGGNARFSGQRIEGSDLGSAKTCKGRISNSL